MRRNHRSKAGDGGGAPSLRLFRSDLLEALTVSSPRSFAVTWALLLACVVWIGGITVGPLPWLGLVLAGLLSWSLFEYAIHRFLFHLRPTSDLGRFLGFVVHGNHHEDPGDPARNMMPLVVSVAWMALFCAMAWRWTGHAGMVFMLGFGLGYVIYDSVHYACHQTPARGRLMRMLRRHHLQHHFARDNGNYAITAIFWDRLFGSQISKPPPRK